MTAEERNARNEKHALNPEPGDFWLEMGMIGVLFVVYVTEENVYFGQDKIQNDDFWEWDITKIKKISRDAFNAKVRYMSIPGFWCDVFTQKLEYVILQKEPIIEDFPPLEESKSKFELTEEEIRDIAKNAIRNGKLTWAGFDLDENGEYRIPVLSKSHYQLIYAVLEHIKGKENAK